MRSRIREIRKAKGLTLADVAARVKPEPTTAQTIGRLETGMRTLSVEWLNRIAEALEVDASELVTLPSHADCPLMGELGAQGRIERAPMEMIDLRMAANDPVALRVNHNFSSYRCGDIIICDRMAADKLEVAHGHDCFIEDTAGQHLFGRLIMSETGLATLVTPDPNPQVLYDLNILWAAKAVTLIRDLNQS